MPVPMDCRSGSPERHEDQVFVLHRGGRVPVQRGGWARGQGRIACQRAGARGGCSHLSVRSTPTASNPMRTSDVCSPHLRSTRSKPVSARLRCPFLLAPEQVASIPYECAHRKHNHQPEGCSQYPGRKRAATGYLSASISFCVCFEYHEVVKYKPYWPLPRRATSRDT